MSTRKRKPISKVIDHNSSRKDTISEASTSLLISNIVSENVSHIEVNKDIISVVKELDRELNDKITLDTQIGDELVKTLNECRETYKKAKITLKEVNKRIEENQTKKRYYKYYLQEGTITLSPTATTSVRKKTASKKNVVKKRTNTILQQSLFEEWFHETYIRNTEGKLSYDDMNIDGCPEGKKSRICEFLKEMNVEYDDKMSGLGTKVKNGHKIYKRGGIQGWIKKEIDFKKQLE
jgi:hypothetical protein